MRKIRSKRVVVPVLTAAVLATACCVAAADRAPATESGSAPVRARGGLLSADVRHEPLARVLRLIAIETGIAITVVGHVQRPVIDVAFTDVPVDEALRRLLRHESAAFLYAPSDLPGATSRLTRVIVLGSAPSAGAEPARSDRLTVRDADITSGSGDAARAPRRDVPGAAATGAPPTSGADETTPGGSTLETLQQRVRQGDGSAVEELKQLLGHTRDPLVRVQAAALLGIASGDDAAAALKDVLSDADPALRLHAVRALGQIGGAGALPVLKDVLVDPDPRIRRMAVRWLGALPGSDARSALQAAALDADESVRREAAEALRKRRR